MQPRHDAAAPGRDTPSVTPRDGTGDPARANRAAEPPQPADDARDPSPNPAATAHDTAHDWATIWQSEAAALATDRELRESWETGLAAFLADFRKPGPGN